MDISSSTTWYYYCVAAALSLMVFLSTRKRKGSLPPGPFAIPLLGHVHLLESNLHQCLAKLSDQYGPLMTFKFGMKSSVVVSSSSMAKQILKDNDETFANRSVPVLGRCFSYDASDILCRSHGPRWRFLRKMCVNNLFSPKSVEALQPPRREEIRRMIHSIYKDSINGVDSGRIDVGAKAFVTSLNLITNMMWNTGSETSGACSSGFEFKNLMVETGRLVSVPNVSDLFPVLEGMDVQGLHRKMRKLMLGFDRLFDGLFEERMSGSIRPPHDFLQTLLDLIKPRGGADEGDDGGERISITEAKGVLQDMISGATDTTSNTVESAMAELLQNPDMMERGQKELEDVVGLHQMVEESHLPQLPYLMAIVKEVLRLHPIAPLLAPHSPDKDCQIGGYTIPKGTQVLFNVWKIQRNPHVWKDPLVFDPERFLNAKWDYNGRDFDYLPFGSGRRICVGLPMAIRMVHYMLASLLHSFNWSLPPGERVDMTEEYCLVIHRKYPLVALPRPRLLRAEIYC